MVCDLADSNDEEEDSNVVCDLAEEGDDVEVGSWSEPPPPMLHPTGDPESRKQGKSSCPPIGLEAAIAMAKAKNTDVASKDSPDEVIDLLSGDEGEDGQGCSPPQPQIVELSTSTSQLNGLANGDRAENAGETTKAKEDAAMPAGGCQKLGDEGEEVQGGPPSPPQTVEVVTTKSQLNGLANEDGPGNMDKTAVATEDVIRPTDGCQKLDAVP